MVNKLVNIRLQGIVTNNYLTNVMALFYKTLKITNFLFYLFDLQT